MLRLVNVGLVLILAQLASAQNKPFDHYKLVKVATTANFLRIHNVSLDDVDIWEEDSSYFQAMVSPRQYRELTEIFPKVEVINNNMQDVADEEYEKLQKRHRRATLTPEGALLDFLPFDEIQQFLDQVMESRERVAHVQKVDLGRSYERRPLTALKISQDDSGAKKPAIFVDAGIHAREWMAPAMANYVIYQLTHNTSHADLVARFDWYVLPVLNPDGYVFSFTRGNRLWRKNRQPTFSRYCVGTDVNRNFGFQWNPGTRGSGASTHPCALTYAGPRAFSTPEAEALRVFLDSNNDTIVGYITLHTYGQYILYPWSYTRTLPIDAETLHVPAAAAMTAMATRVRVGSSAPTLYVASGISSDYAKGRAGIPFSYTFELSPAPGRNSYGFVPPRDKIPLWTPDWWKGVRAVALEVGRLTSTQTAGESASDTTESDTAFRTETEVNSDAGSSNTGGNQDNIDASKPLPPLPVPLTASSLRQWLIQNCDNCLQLLGVESK